MPDPIRTTRLDVPVDENGLPIFVAIEAGEITRYIRSTRLEVPVTEDLNGNKIPVVAVAGGVNMRFELFTLVEELPETGDPNKIYLVPHPANEGGETNQFYECIWINGAWESIGTLTTDTSVNLSDYYTKTSVDTLLSGKVDKVTGKGLSANDLTNELLQKIEAFSDSDYTNEEIEELIDQEIEAYFEDKFNFELNYAAASQNSLANPTRIVLYPEE
jgi:hypothetical protein